MGGKLVGPMPLLSVPPLRWPGVVPCRVWERTDLEPQPVALGPKSLPPGTGMRARCWRVRTGRARGVELGARGAVEGLGQVLRARRGMSGHLARSRQPQHCLSGAPSPRDRFNRHLRGPSLRWLSRRFQARAPEDLETRADQIVTFPHNPGGPGDFSLFWLERSELSEEQNPRDMEEVVIVKTDLAQVPEKGGSIAQVLNLPFWKENRGLRICGSFRQRCLHCFGGEWAP
jgi:hypothetical protein